MTGVTEYRASYRATFAGSVKIMLALGVPALLLVEVGLILGGGSPFSFTDRLLGVLSGTAFVALSIAVLVTVFKTRVSPEGIHGYDFWGLPGDVEWGDIVEVDLFRLAGLEWLRVHRSVARPLYVPLFHVEQDSFESAVLSVVPRDHPVALLLASGRA